MAKFVKLESGKHINVDMVISVFIYDKHTASYFAVGFDHGERITPTDAKNILKAAGSNETKKTPTLSEKTVEEAISALDCKDDELLWKIREVENNSSNVIASQAYDFDEERETIANAKCELEDYLEKLDKHE